MRDWTVPANDRAFWIHAPRRYIGAWPGDGMEGSLRLGRAGCTHWPTEAEYEALHAAAQIGKRKGGKRWCVEVNVRDSSLVARVAYTHDDTPIPNAPYSPYYSSIVRRSNRDAQGCLTEKSWYGLPVWADHGRPPRSRHTYQDTGLFHGPGDCCDGCREQVDVQHRTVVHHHRHGARHFDHGRR